MSFSYKKIAFLQRSGMIKLEADKADQRRVAAAAAVEAGDKPRSWKLPGTNTSMNIGGFVKMSVLWDFGMSADHGHDRE